MLDAGKISSNEWSHAVRAATREAIERGYSLGLRADLDILPIHAGVVKRVRDSQEQQQPKPITSSTEPTLSELKVDETDDDTAVQDVRSLLEKFKSVSHEQAQHVHNKEGQNEP